MKLQEIRDRLVEIKEIHSTGAFNFPGGGSSLKSDPELRAISVALKLDQLLREIRVAIHGVRDGDG